MDPLMVTKDLQWPPNGPWWRCVPCSHPTLAINWVGSLVFETSHWRCNRDMAWHWRDTSHKTFLCSSSKFCKIHTALTSRVITKSSHNFAHATTAELSWHVQHCDLIGSLESKWKQKQLSQHFSFELKNLSWNGSEDSCYFLREPIRMKKNLGFLLW